MKVAEIAKLFDVSPHCVYIWLAKGLPYKMTREVKKKPYKSIQPEDVKKFLNITE